MKIFPLSILGKIVLVIIAIVLGLIFWMMSKPEAWRRRFKKEIKSEPEVKSEVKGEEVRVNGKKAKKQ